MGSGKAPKPTAEQKAMERAQREALDQEKAASERRLKAIAQKKIGKASLLGQPIQQAEAPAGPTTTKGYMVSNGVLKKIPTRAGGLFGKFLGTAFGQAAMGQGMGKKSATGSLLGKSGDKAAKSAITAVTK